jgi:hypothetical protein
LGPLLCKRKIECNHWDTKATADLITKMAVK